MLSISFLSSYSPKFVKEYIEGAKPIFSVGEYWDSCNYRGSYLEYNQGIDFRILEHNVISFKKNKITSSYINLLMYEIILLELQLFDFAKERHLVARCN